MARPAHADSPYRLCDQGEAPLKGRGPTCARRLRPLEHTGCGKHGGVRPRERGRRPRPGRILLPANLDEVTLLAEADVLIEAGAGQRLSRPKRQVSSAHLY